MNDCAHAAGHGYFYYFFDVGKAVLACTDPTLSEHAPGPQYSWDADTRMRCGEAIVASRSSGSL
jgi:hypothetical protein